MKEVKAYYPADILTLELDIRHETDSRLHVKVSEESNVDGTVTVALIRFLLLLEQIIDPSNPRFEVPISVPAATKKAENPDYLVEVCKQPFGVVVRRKTTGAVL